MKRIAVMALCAAVAVILLTGCSLFDYNYQDDVLEYAMISDSGDLSKLDEYPNLQYVDLRGSTCYDAILTYADTHPNVTVRYNVSLGQKRFDSGETAVSLNGYEVDFQLLLANLKYLPALKEVHVNQLPFSRDQLDQLVSTYPGISFTYSVEFGGRRYDSSVEELDLTYLTSEGVEDAIGLISLLPQLRQVNLGSHPNGEKLTVADVTRLCEQFPGVAFNYEFQLFGQQISTLAEELTFDSIQIGNEGVDEFRAALAIMQNCTRVRLDSCGIDDEIMAQLRSEFPEKNVAWRVFAGRYSVMTDEEMIRMPNNLTDKQAQVLKYCTNVRYMDLTSSKISHIEFAADMPLLECVVLSLTGISDLSPLSGCENLTWLELYACSRIKDLSPLSGSQSLKYLNISATQVKDLAALDHIPLERFSCVRTSIKGDFLDAFVQMHPDCLTTSKGSALDYGWRYDDERMSEPFSYYAQMQEIFRYNDKTFKGNTKES